VPEQPEGLGEEVGDVVHARNVEHPELALPNTVPGVRKKESKE
jgi:hypothetical protein